MLRVGLCLFPSISTFFPVTECNYSSQETSCVWPCYGEQVLVVARNGGLHGRLQFLKKYITLATLYYTLVCILKEERQREIIIILYVALQLEIPAHSIHAIEMA